MASTQNLPTFKAKPYKNGKASYVVTIPKALIDSGIVSQEHKTEFIISKTVKEV